MYNLAELVKISSTAFENEGFIPSEFTCDGQDISPPLRFSDIPKETKSLAIIMDDPDAPIGNFTHWVEWNIPPRITEVAKGERFDCVHGGTSFGNEAYGGPCPPSGTHRYFFKVYALDTKLDLKNGSSAKELEKAMSGHILSEATLMGKYSRK